MRTITSLLDILDFFVFGIIDAVIFLVPFGLGIIISTIPVMCIMSCLSIVYKRSVIGSFLLSLLLFSLLFLPLVCDTYIDENIKFSMYRLFKQLESTIFIQAYVISLVFLGIYTLAAPFHLRSLNKIEKGTCTL